MRSPEPRRSERGSTLVLLTVILFSMLALGALSIDLASLRSARSEAQRVADAIALAGASAFRDRPVTELMPTNCGESCQEAQLRALQIARANMVRGDTIYTDEFDVTDNPTAYAGNGFVRTVVTPLSGPSRTQLTLNIIPAVDSQKVRAWVRLAGVQTFFGGLLAKPYGHVQAMATAWATEDGPVVDCLKPFVIPDMWYETDPAQDVNGDHYMDPITLNPGNEQDGESWKFQPPSIGGDDFYIPFNPNVPPDPQGRPQTGYGSPLRSGVESGAYAGDVGLPLVLATQTGAGNTDPAAERMGNAFWMLDFDPDSNTRSEIRSNCATATIGDPVPYDGGARVGQVQQGINEVVNRDPNAVWDPVTKTIVNSDWADWTESPRVVIVGLIDPNFWIANTSNNKPDPGSVFTNFARIFLEPNDPGGPPENIHARFLGTAPGGGGGPTGGPLVKVLQLIE
jgi:Flp pilus assembly protein TadG